jgi:hypothetical protein
MAQFKGMSHDQIEGIYNTRSPLLQDTYNDNRIRYTQDLFYIYLYKFPNSYPKNSGNNMY